MKLLNCDTLGKMCEFLLDGEPVFIIRAQDAAAPEGIKGYAEASRRHGGRNSIRVAEHLKKVMDWQKENPGRVKAPD